MDTFKRGEGCAATRVEFESNLLQSKMNTRDAVLVLLLAFVAIVQSQTLGTCQVRSYGEIASR
jgi:hypothetical protein